jgi:hypothetical protein
VPEINQHGQTVNDIVPDWKGASVLTRTPLVGRYCRLEPLDQSAIPPNSLMLTLWGMTVTGRGLPVRSPPRLKRHHWVLGKVMDDALVPYAVIDSHRPCGGAGELYGD